MWRFTAIIFLCSVAVSRLALADPGALSSNDWTVRSSSGDVSAATVGPDNWRSIKTGKTLTAPFSIRTAATGQAILIRGDDTLLVAPQSVIEVRAASHSDAGLITRILQSIGSLVYQVEKRPQQRFEVKTPYLVSVVKGTTFTISVTEREAVVSLEEGSLEILGKDGAHRGLLKPGEIARSKQGTNHIEMSNAQAQRSQWGAWHPANTKRDAGNSKRRGLDVARMQVPAHALHSPGLSGSAPGRSGFAPGLSGSAPGRSGFAPGLSGSAPGRSGFAPGLSGTAPGRSGFAPGLSGTAPGRSGSAPGLSGTAPGLTK